jgi:hypothetical protein
MSAVTLAEPRIEETVRAFENATIEPGDFNHEAHIQVGWRYLQDYDQQDAISRFIGAIRRLTHKLGVPGKYHETITWFYLLKIAERCRDERAGDWQTFKAANPDLFERNPSLIQKYYSDALLSSEIARRSFVLPDRKPD